MAKKHTIESMVELLEKEFFLGDDIIMAVRGEDGKASFLGAKISLFFEIFEKEKSIDYIMWLVPKFATEFSKSGEKIIATMDDISQIIGKGTEPISLENTEELIHELVRVKGVYIVEGGLLLAGNNLEELATVGKIMEKAALLHLEGKYVGTPIPFKDEVAEAHKKNYIESYSKLKSRKEMDEDYIDRLNVEEKAVAKEIIKVGKSLNKNNLTIATWGNLSIRLDEQWMMVTPSGIPYTELKPLDMVKVNINTKETIGRLKPTSEVDLHIEIYKLDKEAKAIVHSHGIYASIFASLGRDIPVMSKDMKEVVNGPLMIVPYYDSGTIELAKATSKIMKKYGTKGVILKNHGTVNYGSSLKEAFDGCCIIDDSAKTYVDRKKGIFEYATL